jgi:hypothetical protein
LDRHHEDTTRRDGIFAVHTIIAVRAGDWLDGMAGGAECNDGPFDLFCKHSENTSYFRNLNVTGKSENFFESILTDIIYS